MAERGDGEGQMLLGSQQARVLPWSHYSAGHSASSLHAVGPERGRTAWEQRPMPEQGPRGCTYRCDGKEIEHLAAVLPGVGVAVFALALLVKTVHLRDLS
jgi:hypothetical protein